MPGISRALTLRSRYRTEITDAAPAFVTILMMPFTNTIAHGFIGGYGAFIICKFCTYKLHPWQKTWPGYALHTRWTEPKSTQVCELQPSVLHISGTRCWERLEPSVTCIHFRWLAPKCAHLVCSGAFRAFACSPYALLTPVTAIGMPQLASTSKCGRSD